MPDKVWATVSENLRKELCLLCYLRIVLLLKGASLVHVLLKKSAAHDYHKYVVSSKKLGGSGFGFVIQDYTDHGASKERSFSSSHQLPWQQPGNCRVPQRNRALNLKTKTRWPSRIEQLKYLLLCNWAPLRKMIDFGSFSQNAFDRSLIWKWICSKGTLQIRNPDPDSPKGTNP